MLRFGFLIIASLFVSSTARSAPEFTDKISINIQGTEFRMKIRKPFAPKIDIKLKSGYHRISKHELERRLQLSVRQLTGCKYDSKLTLRTENQLILRVGDDCWYFDLIKLSSNLPSPNISDGEYPAALMKLNFELGKLFKSSAKFVGLDLLLLRRKLAAKAVLAGIAAAVFG